MLMSPATGPSHGDAPETAGEGAPARSVLIFTRGILPQSETFIQDHVMSLRRYRPCLVGFSLVPGGLTVPGCDARVLSPAPSRLGRAVLAFSPFGSRIDGIARAVSPALVHAHFLVNALPLLPFLRRNRLPLVVTAHGHDVAADPRRMRLADRLLYATRLKALGRYVDRVICVSDTVRGFAIERGLPAEKCVVQHLGITVARFTRAQARPRRGRVLFVGRLVEKKGLDYLLDAAALLKGRGIRLDLRIIGDGPERARLEARNRALGVDATFLGPQPRSRVEAELAASWIFAMPSVRAANGDSEGLPIVFLEAQAAGVPVVAFDNGPAREAVVHGRTGLLAPERDVAALADSLARLVTEDGLRDGLSAQATAHVARHFDLAANTGRLESLYDEVVRRHAARRPVPRAGPAGPPACTPNDAPHTERYA